MSTTSHQNQNQFAPTAVLGAPDLAFNFNTKSAIIDPESTSTHLQVGQAMKLVAGAVPGLLVDVAAANEKAFGVIINSLKKNVYTKGQAVEIACRGNVLYLETSAAVSRGDIVQNDPTGPTVATLTSGAPLGLALDQADGAGVLIRVEIDPASAA